MALIDEIEEALQHIPIEKCSREEWVYVGMALKNEGIDCDVWDRWSSLDAARYHPGECQRKWNGFNRSGLTRRYIFGLSKKYGHIVRGSKPHDSKVNDYKPQKVIIESTVKSDEPKDDWKPQEDLKTYLSLLFNPDDIIGYSVESKWNTKYQKWDPTYREPGRNKPARTVEEIIAEIDSGRSFAEIFGGYNELADVGS